MKNITRKSALVCVLCLFMALSTACSSSETTRQDNTSSNDASNASVVPSQPAEPQTEAAEPVVVQADSQQPAEAQPEATAQAAPATPAPVQTNSVVNNKYARTVTEVIDGKNLTFETSYAFFSDNTGIICKNYDFREVYGFTWDNNKIYFCYNTSYSYTLEGDVLKINNGKGVADFTKKVETDPIFNGDFSAFAGTYKATYYTNKDMGCGGEVADAKLNSDGTFSGGYIKVLEDFDSWPDDKPFCIEKMNDGSYFCILSVYPNNDYDYHEDGSAEIDGYVEIGYIIYPKNASKQFSDEPDYFPNNVYFRIVGCDGGEIDEQFYKAQ